jgi:hypothetical protein
MAMLDAILEPDWEYRFYSFNHRWATGEQMGSMRDGQGDDFFALFNQTGCWLKGFAHESPMAPYRTKPKQVWPGVLEFVPAEFTAYLNEPAFSVEDTTFWIWRRHDDQGWKCGSIEFPPGEADPDGSESLLSPLDGNPQTYRDWAAEYFSIPTLGIEPVRHVYEHRPLTPEILLALNPTLVLEELADDIEEIGYPAI